MVKHNGLAVEVLSEPRDLLEYAPAQASSSSGHVVLVHQPFSVNAPAIAAAAAAIRTADAAQQPSLMLRIGSEPTDLTVLVQVAIAINGRPFVWGQPQQQRQHSFVLQAKGLYDGQWRDRGLWHDVVVPISDVSFLQQSNNTFTVQVLFYEIPPRNDGPADGSVTMPPTLHGAQLLQVMTMHLVQQAPKIGPEASDSTQQQASATPPPRLLGQKRPEQSFGYDQKAVCWKRRRTCSSENASWSTSTSSCSDRSATTTDKASSSADCGMIMG